jgi:hypothetical protein
VFTKGAGSNSYTFHGAVDNKGATFALMRASEDGGVTWKTIGGYDPLGWDTTTNYFHYPDNPADWTAFIFNLTNAEKRDQQNGYQTFNHLEYGPTFGQGHDLYVDQSLTTGFSSKNTYCAGCSGSIVDGSAYDGTNMQIGALEVFTIGAFVPVGGTVPEPASLSLIAMGLLGWGAARRKKSRAA